VKNLINNNVMDERVIINGCSYELNQVDATDGLDMVGKLQPMQVSRYFDKYVYRTKDGIAMACYVNDIDNCWRI
jgi:hypothetical protein